jgi:hypothetical protein
MRLSLLFRERPLSFLGGYLFGVYAGMFYSMIGLIVGSWLSFSIARIFGRRVVERFVSPELRKKLKYLSGHEGVILGFLLFFNSWSSEGRPVLPLRSDANAIRDFSHYLNHWEDTRNIAGNTSGRKGL